MAAQRERGAPDLPTAGGVPEAGVQPGAGRWRDGWSAARQLLGTRVRQRVEDMRRVKGVLIEERIWSLRSGLRDRIVFQALALRLMRLIYQP